MKKLIVDLDGTLTQANTSDYENVLPRKDVIEQVRKYSEKGF
ncbi:capsular biosynthesis protein, partial [Vibrio parahaemolyticus]